LDPETFNGERPVVLEYDLSGGPNKKRTGGSLQKSDAAKYNE